MSAKNKVYFKDSYAWILMLGVMILVAVAATVLAIYVSEHTDVLTKLLERGVKQRRAITGEIKGYLVASIWWSLFLACAGGVAWWAVGKLGRINGPGDVGNKVFSWLALFIIGVIATAWAYYAEIMHQAHNVTMGGLAVLALFPVLSFIVAYWIGTGLFSPAVLVSSVPFYRLRKRL